MFGTLRRLSFVAAALVVDIAVSMAPAPAAIDMSMGESRVVNNASITDCNTRAQAALSKVLQSPSQAGSGTGEWMALTPVTPPATPPEAASIHCFPIGTGYLVTFECAVEIPPSSMSANDLCAKVTAAFDSQQAATSGASRG